MAGPSVRVIKVAAVQLRALGLRDDDPQPDALAAIALAGRQGAKLIVLPECTWPGYLIRNRSAYDASLAARQHTFDAILSAYSGAAQAAGAAVIVGLAEPRMYAEPATTPSALSLHNAAYCFDSDGWLRGVARKQMLWDADDRAFSAGGRCDLVTFPKALGEDLPIGVYICADNRKPEIVADLVARGAKLLALPTAWVASSPDGTTLFNQQAEFMLADRGRELRTPIVVADKVGLEAGLVRYAGCSGVVDARGRWQHKASATEPAVVIETVQLDCSPAAGTTTGTAAGTAPGSGADGWIGRRLAQGPDWAAIDRLPREAVVLATLLPTVTVLERQMMQDREAFLADVAALGSTLLVVQLDRESNVSDWQATLDELKSRGVVSQSLALLAWPSADELAVPSLQHGNVPIRAISRQQLRSWPACRAASMSGCAAVATFDIAEADVVTLRTRAAENGIFVFGVGQQVAALAMPDGRVVRTFGDPPGALTVRMPIAAAADRTAGLRTPLFLRSHG